MRPSERKYRYRLEFVLWRLTLFYYSPGGGGTQKAAFAGYN